MRFQTGICSFGSPNCGGTLSYPNQFSACRGRSLRDVIQINETSLLSLYKTAHSSPGSLSSPASSSFPVRVGWSASVSYYLGNSLPWTAKPAPALIGISTPPHPSIDRFLSGGQDQSSEN